MDASCQTTNNEQTRTINSPNYPSSYPNSKYCTWKITAPIGAKLMIKSFSYSMESNSGCEYDSLKIYDGPSTGSFRKANLCGTNEWSTRYTSTSNTLFLVFESDSSTRYKGFQLTYSLIGTNLWLNHRTFITFFHFFITMLSIFSNLCFSHFTSRTRIRSTFGWYFWSKKG